MKRILATTALAMLISGPAFAEAHMGGFVDQAEQSDIYGSNLIGMRLYVAENEFDESTPVTADQRAEWNDVGEINDVLISRDGQVEAVLLDIGGFLGLGEKTVAVSMDSLKFLRDNDDPDDIFVAVQGSQAMLEEAPEFQRAEMTDDMAAEEQTAEAETEMAAEEAEVDAEATETAEAAETMPSDDPAMTAWQRPAIEREGYARIEAGDLTAEDFEGANVYGVNDETIGEVENLVVTEDGQIQEAIMDIGGFLGLGEHRIAVNFDEMEIIRSEDGSDLRVYISATQEQLESRPEYEG